MAPVIRPATDDDRPAILALVASAFRDHDGGREEVHICEATWRDHAAAYDLVADADDQVIGHVLCAWGRLDDGDADPSHRRRALGVAPLAVDPAHQLQGVGTALMTELFRRGADQELMLLLGDPDYYGRFGFEPAGRYGIAYPPVGPDSPSFQIRRLGGYDPAARGDYAYCWELNGSAL